MSIPFRLTKIEDITRVGQYLRSLNYSQPVKVEISEWQDKRSLEQNAKMWAMLADISRQVCWYNQWLTPENWKDMITAALNGQKSAPGIEGGVVFFGARTSKMSIKQMSDLIEYAYWFGAEKGVKWSMSEEEFESLMKEVG
jgi:hypothetical protein